MRKGKWRKSVNQEDERKEEREGENEERGRRNCKSGIKEEVRKRD